MEMFQGLFASDLELKTLSKTQKRSVEVRSEERPWGTGLRILRLWFGS